MLVNKRFSEKGQNLIESAIILALAMGTVFGVLVYFGFMPNPFAKPPVIATNPPKPGYNGSQTSAQCTPLAGYQTCATSTVTYEARGEQLILEGFVNFAWNNAGNEANSVGSATVTLSYANGSLSVPVTIGANLVGQNYQYLLVGLTVPGYGCIARDSSLQVWDCNRQ